jgi:hypothetical protein
MGPTAHDRADGHLCLLFNVAGQRALVLRGMGRVGARRCGAKTSCSSMSRSGRDRKPWSAMQQIADWLQKLAFGQYTQHFAENEIDSKLPVGASRDEQLLERAA